MPKILPDKAYILSRIEVDPVTGCWLWLGPTYPAGYGKAYVHTLRSDGTRSKYKTHYGAHTVAWEVWNGAVPEGLELDHLCRTRRCVRPTLSVLGEPLIHPLLDGIDSRLTPQQLLLAGGQHLEPVTHLENVLRSNGPTAINARKEACPQGHPYKPRMGQPGTEWGYRYCPECKNAQRRASKVY